MSLSEHVSLTITRDSVGISTPGFGTALITSFSKSSEWSERTREYAGIAELAEDFDPDEPEYLAANALFAQTPHPEKVLVGRFDLHPTQRYTLNARTITDDEDYFLRAVGIGVTETTTDYTSGTSATRAQIHNGALVDLNAVVGKNFTAAFAALVVADFTFVGEADDDTLTAVAHGLQTGDGPVRVANSGGALPTGLAAATDYYVIRTGADTFKLATTLAFALAGTAINLTTDGTGTQTLSDTVSTVRPSDPFTVTADSGVEWFALEAIKPELWDIAQDHANPGIATDLAAITVETEDWYGLVLTTPSDAMVKAAASWIESNGRMYFAGLSESIAINVAADGTQGTADDIKTLAYTRTATFYHPKPDQFFDAAIMGRYFATEPGASTVAYRRLAGVSATKLTSTQRTNLNNRNCSYYKTEAGINITWKGKVASGEYIDVTRDLDWVYSDMQRGVFGGLAAQEKVPFSNPGIEFVKGKVRDTLDRAVAKGIFLGDPTAEPPTPFVSAPKLAAISDTDKGDRHLPDVKWSAELANAILTAAVTGVVTN